MHQHFRERIRMGFECKPQNLVSVRPLLGISDEHRLYETGGEAVVF
jgi:hypothetical protein